MIFVPSRQDRTSCLALNERFGSQLHWFVPAGLASWVRGNAGVDPENIHEMVWWQQETHPRTNATVGETAGPGTCNKSPSLSYVCNDQITFTPANHWTRRGLFDRNKVLWGSWAVVDDSGKSFWFAGDTAYADVFQQIGNRFGGFDLAAIPIGINMLSMQPSLKVQALSFRYACDTFLSAHEKDRVHEIYSLAEI